MLPGLELQFCLLLVDYFDYLMIERREEEEKEKGVQHGHAAGAEKEQEGDGV